MTSWATINRFHIEKVEQINPMTLERTRLTSVFSRWGLEVTRPDAPISEELVADGTARRTLSDIGIPERVGGRITLHDFSDGPATVADLLGNPSGIMQGSVGDYVYLGSGDGILLLNGTTGEVFSWREQSLSRINSTLAAFVEFLMLIQEQLNQGEEDSWSENDEESRNATTRLMFAFREVDRAAMEQAGEYWRRSVRETFAAMGF